METHNCLYLQFQGIQHPLLASKDTRHANSAQLYMQAKCPHMQKKKKINLKTNKNGDKIVTVSDKD